jgi:hypothetical protein
MGDRSLASLLGALILIGVLELRPVTVTAQTRAPAPAVTPATAKAWTPPLTPHGQPDLEGIWLNSAATPLERPKALEGRAFLTDAEVAELTRRAERLFDGSGSSDFAAGDNFFLALLADLGRYENPNATGSSREMIRREFDNRTSLIVDPPDGRIPSLTPEGRERLARMPTPAGAGPRIPAGPEDLSPGLRCISYGVPRLGTANINSAGPMGYYQILQAPGYVVLALEAIHEARIIPVDAPGKRPHLPPSLRQWSGDSRGRWEGNTLVVDTTNFSTSNSFMGSAENLHLVERLTRTAPDTITYEITVTDATTWTRPWTAVIRLKRSDDKLYEYACHEGNAGTMRAMLAGARAQESAAGEAVKGRD